ncbi:MAG: head maturation protease, ClpP-related [Candidatus Nanopelagicales bacterium]
MSILDRMRERLNRPSNIATWYRIEAKDTGTDVYIYDEIGGWGTQAAQFVSELNGITSVTINLHLNSPGGDAFDGMAIMNSLRNHSATVNVSVDGLAASAASYIAMAGDTVTMQPGSRMMIHDASAWGVGNAGELRELADMLDGVSADIAGLYASRAGGTQDEWRTRMKAETWYSASEAVEAGLADGVAEDACKPRKSSNAAAFDFAACIRAANERLAAPKLDTSVIVAAIELEAANRPAEPADPPVLTSVGYQFAPVL